MSSPAPSCLVLVLALLLLRAHGTVAVGILYSGDGDCYETSDVTRVLYQGHIGQGPCVSEPIDLQDGRHSGGSFVAGAGDGFSFIQIFSDEKCQHPTSKWTLADGCCTETPHGHRFVINNQRYNSLYSCSSESGCRGQVCRAVPADFLINHAKVISQPEVITSA